jgi:hypothetical protein
MDSMNKQNRQMSLNEFIDKYDKEGTVILLEGKRKVLPDDAEKLRNLGRILAEKSKYMTFRSGNASGSDEYFSAGVASMNKDRLEVIVPYKGHRVKTNCSGKTIALDEIDLTKEKSVVKHSMANKKSKGLIDRYISGYSDTNAMKGAYLIRDTVKAVGTTKIKPTTLGIFYDDLKNPMDGGTGHTMKVCLDNGIPIIDQSTWFSWLD